MILYLAFNGNYQNLLRPIKANILKSYAPDYRPNTIKILGEEPWPARYFLDSGAFTAFTKKQEINIAEHAEFIQKHRTRIAVAANLDAIGNAEATWQNQLTLESLGVDVLPVYHYGEPKSYLERYVAKYRYIAIGGLVPVSRKRKAMTAFLDNVFGYVRGRALLHGFGVNGLWAWKRYPFYSVDATSWLMGSRVRQVQEFDGRDFHEHTRLTRTPHGFMAATCHHNEINLNQARTYMTAAQYVTDMWTARGIDYANETDGPIKRS